MDKEIQRPSPGASNIQTEEMSPSPGAWEKTPGKLGGNLKTVVSQNQMMKVYQGGWTDQRSQMLLMCQVRGGLKTDHCIQ